MEKIVICILNYNGFEDTLECIKSIKPLLKNKKYNIILLVIDNGSTNQSVKVLDKFLGEFEDYQFVDNMENISTNRKIILYSSKNNNGFAGGNNKGITITKRLNSNYILMLNNDTTVDEKFIFPLMNIIQNDSSIGIVGSKIINYYDHNEYILGGELNLRKCSGYHYYNSEKMDKKYVSFLSGCVWLMKMEAIEKCGLLDSNYFLYVEDVDYCFRMVKKGYKLSCSKDSIVYHKESKSSPNKPVIAYYNTRNRLYLNKKMNKSILGNFAFYSYFIVTRVIRILSKKQNFKYVWKGVKDYKNKSFGMYNE